MEDETLDLSIGIRQSCEFCAWKSESYPYGSFGEAEADKELAQHQINDHPRSGTGRIGVYVDGE